MLLASAVAAVAECCSYIGLQSVRSVFECVVRAVPSSCAVCESIPASFSSASSSSIIVSSNGRFLAFVSWSGNSFVDFGDGNGDWLLSSWVALAACVRSSSSAFAALAMDAVRFLRDWYILCIICVLFR